ncbi:Rop family plasmid primer RNA-binding protein, partial [Escherichia coli]|nr:Rop family plasmid primer RNA-binding protein [Escherichia coli]
MSFRSTERQTPNPYCEHPLAFHRYHYPMNRNPPYTEASVTKQEKTALNMARFI